MSEASNRRATGRRRSAAEGSKEPLEPSPTRGARRRADTRARLIRAAGALIGAKGSEAVTIQEITAAADVGFGSFYNHFDSKQAILEAVIDGALELQGQLLDGLSAGIADPAERVALALKANLAAAVADPQWGWLMVRLRESNPEPFFERLGRRGLRDVEAGVEAGRFRVDEPVSASVVIGAALFGVVRAVLDGRLQESSGVALAEYALRILGLSHEDAAAIALRTGAPLVATRPLGRA